MAKKLTITIALVAGLMMLATGVALAVPSEGTVIPHGGYDTLTDACLQCHDIHEAANDYVLLRWQTVTDTCGSCHNLYTNTYPLSPNGGSTGGGTFNSSPVPGVTPAYDPGYDPQDETRAVDALSSNAVGSKTSAYEVTYASKDAAPGHTLQRGPGTYTHADGAVKPGDYIPGGDSALTAIKRAQYPQTENALFFSGTNGLNCASCHTPHGNFGKQLLKTGSDTTVVVQEDGRYKLLSGKPNHNRPGPVTGLKIDDWVTEGGKWCEECHTRRAPEAEGIYHNHPDTWCLVCHGNDTVKLPLNTDFPHTGSNENLLSQAPDGLCISCHKKGTLP